MRDSLPAEHEFQHMSRHIGVSPSAKTQKTWYARSGQGAQTDAFWGFPSRYGCGVKLLTVADSCVLSLTQTKCERTRVRPHTPRDERELFTPPLWIAGLAKWWARTFLGFCGLRVCSLDVSFASATVRNRPQRVAFLTCFILGGRFLSIELVITCKYCYNQVVSYCNFSKSTKFSRFS